MSSSLKSTIKILFFSFPQIEVGFVSRAYFMNRFKCHCETLLHTQQVLNWCLYSALELLSFAFIRQLIQIRVRLLFLNEALHMDSMVRSCPSFLLKSLNLQL